MNPYSTMRAYLRISQTALAQRANCTAQYIRRLEQGTVSAPSGAVNRALVEYARLSNKLQLFIEHCQKEASVYQTKTSPKNFQLFVEDWWSNYVRITRSQRTSDQLPEISTLYHLARFFVMHPYVLEYYAKNKDDMPISHEIDQVIRETGISLTQFEETLKRIYDNKGERNPRDRA